MSERTEVKAETEVKQDQKNKISDLKLKTLTSIRDTGIQIRNAIGDLEIRKQELFIQHIGIKQQMEKEAEAALIEAGIDQGSLKEYRIDLKTGEFTR